MKKKVEVVVIMAMVILSAGMNLYAAETGRPLLADKHKAAGIECVSCHGNDVTDMVSNRSCLVCHSSFEKLAERTSDMHINPHRSIHFMDYECAACHHGHKPLNNFCQNCHGPIVRHK